MTIEAFIKARLDEDEADAERAGSKIEGALWVVTGMDNAVGVDYDPGHVLAQVRALRAILAIHHVPDRLVICNVCRGDYDVGIVWPCPTARSVAAIWDQHPEYLPEWSV